MTGTTSIMTITSLGQLHREEIVQTLHLNAFVLVGNLCVDHVPLADGIQINCMESILEMMQTQMTEQKLQHTSGIAQFMVWLGLL